MGNKFKRFDKIVHIKSGEIYDISDVPNAITKLEYCNEGFYRYISEKRDAPVLWLRCKTEMEDGRFELLTES